MSTVKQQKKHKWSENDDIVALYFARYGPDLLEISLAKASATLGIKDGSMKMRISNYNGKLEHIAKQSKRVRQQYEKQSEPELRAIVKKILVETRGSFL